MLTIKPVNLSTRTVGIESQMKRIGRMNTDEDKGTDANLKLLEL